MAAGAAATLDIAGSLAIGDAASLAAQTDSIASAGTAAFITKTGAGTLVLNGNNTAYLGTLDIAAGAVQINSAAALPGGAINGAGTLILNNAGGNPALAAGDFHGTLRLAGTPAGAGTACDLDALAPASPARAILAASRLQLAAGGALALAAGAHALGGLDFAGGDFHTRRDGFGFSGTLGVSGTLALTDPVTSKIIFDDFNPGDSMGSLYGGAGGGVFSLDEAGANAVLLIAAGALAPGHEGRTVKLYAGDGATLIATSQTLALDASAVGTFENMAIAITGSAGAGLYMDSLLQQIEILPGKTYTLAADPATDNTLLNTTITGAGRLAIDAAGAAVTLGAANTHTGETRVTTGTLRLAAAGALGDTAGLVIDAGAAVQLDGDAIYGNLQSIGAYTGAPGARLALGTGTLAVTAAKGPGLFTDNGAATDLGAAGRLILNGGLISGPLTAAAAGAARLDLAAGTTTITSANPSLAITTAVAAGATLRLADGRALGAGAIAFDGTLELAASSTATAAGLLLNPLSGSGAITKTGAGAMGIASANPDLAVPVSVLEGTLVLASLEALGSGSTAGAITLAEGAAVEFSGVAGAIANPVAGDGTLAFAGSANVEIARPIPVPRALIRDGAVVTLTGAGALGGAAGRITIEDNGALAIDLYDHTLATVTLNRNGRIRLTPAGTAFRKLTINRLEGSGGILEVNIDFKRVRDYSVVALTPVIPAGVAADHFTIAGSGGGAHGVLVNSANPAFTAPLDGSYTPLISTAAGDSSRYHLVDAAGAAIPHYESGLVALKLVKGGEDESTYTSDPGAWYLADSGLASVADAIIGTAAMAGKDWHYSIDALYLRMGDVRAAWQTPAPGAARGNVWARARAYRLKANYKLLGRSFDETLHGLTAGADYAFRPREEITLLAGAFFDGGRVTRDFVNHGGGESGTFGAGLYASLLFENGWHGDLVLKSDRSKNSFDARTVDSRLTRGRYNSTAEGFSAELGRRFQLKDDWWFESSLQLATAWLDAAAYEAQTSESPIPVRVDGSRSTQYRGGLRIGRMVDRWTPYAKIAWAKTDTAGGVIHAHTRAFDPGMNGWRFETGAGASLRLGDRAALHFDYEYATADAYQRPWSIHLGYRTQW
jgi:outer membrane autotransporter protein